MAEQVVTAQENTQAVTKEAPPTETKQAATETTAAVETKAQSEGQSEKVTKDEPKAKVVPEKYDFKMPEDSSLDKGYAERIAAEVEKTARKQGLTNAEAQKLLDSEHKKFASFVEHQQEQLKVRSSEWVEELKSDPKIGGENFKRSAELAKRVMQRYGSESLLNKLDESGLGNHPDLVRFVVAVGNAMSEDQLVIGGNTVAGSKDPAEVLYGATSQK